MSTLAIGADKTRDPPFRVSVSSMLLPAPQRPSAPPRNTTARTRQWRAAAGLFFGLTFPADAQELDYGKYESLFGEAVTMSATGKPERVSDSPILLDVITAGDIHRSGARDIPTLLHRLAGIDLMHTAPSSQELGAGGYLQAVGSRVMVLVNGRQIYFDGFGDVFWSSIPVELDEIRQIEVSFTTARKAPFTASTPSTASSISSPSTPSTTRSTASRRAPALTAAGICRPITTQALGENAGFRLTAAGDHAHDYGLTPTLLADHTLQRNPDRRSLSFDGGLNLADGDRLNLAASHSDVTERAIVYGVFFNGRLLSDSLKAGYIANTDIGHVNASVAYSGITAPRVQTLAFPAFGVADSSIVAQVSDVLKVGLSDSVRVGLDARHDSLSGGTMTMGWLTGDLGGASAMWEHNFSPALSVVDAVRYDHFALGRSGQALPLNLYSNDDFDRSVGGFSLNSALIDRVTADDNLRLSFARGLKLPSLADFGQVEHTLPQFYGLYHYGNPNLLPSAVYDYQAGWDHEIRAWDAESRITVFHQMTMHHIGSVFTTVDGALVEASQMAAGSVANGIELGLKHQARQGWVWGANYTFERLHEHSDQGIRDALPVHKLNANLGYGWDSWDADVALFYASATKGSAFAEGSPTPLMTTAKIKSYASLAPRLAWHADDRLSVELAAESLWPYRDSVGQRMESTYFLTVKLSY